MINNYFSWYGGIRTLSSPNYIPPYYLDVVRFFPFLTISVISFLFSFYNIDSPLARCVCLSVLVIARGNFTALYYIEII